MPWISWALCSALIVWPYPRWQCTFLNVGQGDCCVLQIGRSVFVIDAGPEYQRALKPYLQSEGIRKIDGVWVSHGDWDHTEGLMELLEDPDFTVENWYLPAGEIHANDRMSQIEAMGQRVYRVSAGDEIQIGSVRFRCESPVYGQKYADENSASMTIRISDGRTSLFLCGDMDQAGERQILERMEACDILKVGHHGSQTSSSVEWIARMAPQVAVISCDREGGYGHPHPEVVKRLQNVGARVLVTDDVGAVQVWSGWFGRYHYRTGK